MTDRLVAFITGGTRGIGRAIGEALAAANYKVVLTYYSKRDVATKTEKEFRASGADVLTLEMDVSVKTSVCKGIAATIDAYGRIDLLVNNAGILQQKPFCEISDTDWDRMLAVNLKGAFTCSQQVLPIMERQGGGSIINIVSSGGQVGGTLAVHYAASKAGLISLTKSLARLGAPYGIRANCISPGLIETEMTEQEIASELGQAKIARDIPLGKVGMPSDVASLAAFLASNKANYITGQTYNVNGGLYMG